MAIKLILIITFAILAILLDIYIYKRIALTGKRWLKVLYTASIIMVDGAIITALLFYHRCSNIESQSYMQIIIWVILLFFISVIPKLVYVLFSLLDYPVQWICKRKVGLFKWIGIGCALVVLATMVWGATEGRNRIIINEVVLESDKIPEAFDGYRIVFFTDLHIGNFSKNSTIVERMVTKINGLNPDAVMNGGDIINLDARELNKEQINILSRIESKDGVYSVLGNHDLGVYMRHSQMTPEENLKLLYEKYAELGWPLLDNETRYIKRDNDSISVTGIKYPAAEHGSLNGTYTGDDLEAAYRGVNDSTYNIMISHTPNKWDEIRSYGLSDITLSGHAHAMQLKIGFGKQKWSPAKFLYPRWSGLYPENVRKLYVNDGMGFAMFPMRINAYPEITLFILKKSADQ